MNNSPKQVIVMRKDLNMRKGKMCAQAAHASMKVLLDRMYDVKYEYHTNSILQIWHRSALKDWLDGKFTKICVGVDSEAEMLSIYNKAIELIIPCALITDSGDTEFGGVPTNTCIAVGPQYSDKIDEITGHLRLL